MPWRRRRPAMTALSASRSRRPAVASSRRWARHIAPCSPTRLPRWLRRWPSSGLSALSRGRPACPSGCAWRCILVPARSATATTFGPVVNRAARLLDVGHGGQVLVTAATYALVADRLPGGIGLEDLGEQRLKDLGRAERVFQVTGPGLAEGFGVLRSLDDPALRHNLPSQADQLRGPGRRAGRAAVAGVGRVAAGHDRGAGRDRQVPAGAAGGGRVRWMAPATGCGWSSWRRWPNPSWWPVPWPPCSGSARSRGGPCSTP